jgi:hypothetical protein
MGYIYQCDGFCEQQQFDERPALTGEFNETWYESTPCGDVLRQRGYEPGDLVTLCSDCTMTLLEHDLDVPGQ